ncbi:hypothetical protein ACSBR1_035247 [Camellia fascicularis]|uniref:probable E3 ubiquitin-protein ligase ATL44 n=1 Tax=Camellia sinensis TaxID=4442 RepID=UPI00103623BA|nr:probable E3 ubiquitin-protein ligase ATL44 [Camellia sinensis]
MGLQDPHPFNFIEPNNKTLQIDSRTFLLGSISLLLLLISTFSFTYFLYYFIRHRQSAAANHPPPPPPPPPGLDKASINCLPIISFGSSGLSSGDSWRVGECSICLGAFKDGEKVKVLPLCYHGFHSECVDKWLRTRSSCPLCRAAVVRVDSLAQSDIP